jgi:DNA-directed RNA polymerase specialized sigma subunit
MTAADRRMRRALRTGTAGLDTKDDKALYVAARHEAWEAVLEALVVDCDKEFRHAAYNAPENVDYREAYLIAKSLIIDAVDGFDPSRASFGTYLQHSLRAALKAESVQRSPGFHIPKRTLFRFWKLRESCDSYLEMQERCQEFDIAPDTLRALWAALYGQRSVDAGGTVRSEYDDGEGPEVEGLLRQEWVEGPDISVWEAADSLSDKQSEALMLWSQGLSTVEIGHRLGVDQSTAWRRVEGALASLRGFYACGA